MLQCAQLPKAENHNFVGGWGWSKANVFLLLLFSSHFVVCNLWPLLAFNFNSSCCELWCSVRHIFHGVALFMDGFNGPYQTAGQGRE
jgi:hypothetical protein